MAVTREIETTDRVEILDITDLVEAAVPVTADAGLCSVFVSHTTAGLAVNEAEPGLLQDIESTLERLIPGEESYDHDRIDDNADAHLRNLLLQSSVTLPIRDGALALGTWQSVLFVESDGPRTRTVTITVVE